MTIDFETKIEGLVKQSKKAVEKKSKEEATKHAVVMLFIKALGYNIHELDEVDPAFRVTIGTKENDEIDYAIKMDGEPVMLIEAKRVTEKLAKHSSQLFRYFGATDAPIAISTNGIEAWFYADINKDNVMDEEPFFKFNFQQNSEKDRDILKLFHKSKFDVNHITSVAYEINQSASIRQWINSNITNPSEEFVKHIGREINNKNPKKDEILVLQKLVKETFGSIIAEKSPIPTNAKSDSPAQGINQNASDMRLPIESLSNPQGFEERYEELGKGELNRYDYISKEPRKATFLQYVDKILSLGNVEKEVMNTAVFFSLGGKRFTSIQPQKRTLKIGLVMEITEIAKIEEIDGNKSFFEDRKKRKKLCLDREGIKTICVDRKKKGKLGAGNTSVDVNEKSDHECVFNLIEQVYKKWSR